MLPVAAGVAFDRHSELNNFFFPVYSWLMLTNKGEKAEKRHFRDFCNFSSCVEYEISFAHLPSLFYSIHDKPLLTQNKTCTISCAANGLQMKTCWTQLDVVILPTNIDTVWRFLFTFGWFMCDLQPD